MSDTPKISFDVEARLDAFAIELQKAESMARTAGEKIARAQAQAVNQSSYFGSQAQTYDAGLRQAEVASSEFAAKLKRQMQGQMEQTGAAAGESFAKGFDGEKRASEIERKLTAGIKKFVIVGAADTLIRGMAQAMREANDWGDVGMIIGNKVLDGIKSVPIAGAFGELGEALSERLAPAADDVDGWAKWRVALRMVPGGSMLEKPLLGDAGNIGASAKGDTRGPTINSAPAMRAFDAANSRLSEFGMAPSELQEKRFNEELKRLEAEGKAAQLVDLDERLGVVRATMQQQLQAMRDEEQEAEQARRDIEDAALDDERWRAQDREFAAERKRIDEAAMDSRRERLGLIEDEMSALRGVSASNFIEARDTAIGSFRFAQDNASEILADNSERLVTLTERQVQLLDDIKRLQGGQYA